MAAPSSINPFFADELKIFLMVNMAQNNSNLGKKAQANKLQNQIESFLRDERVGNRINLRLFKVSMKLGLNMPQEAKTLLGGVDKETLEKDVLLAQTLYSLKEFKNYYLKCIELVTSLKSENKRASSQDRVEAEHQRFLLGYCYFMKALAETTFLQARKQGIMLKEDFGPQESQFFNSEYFKAKAEKSLIKASFYLEGWPEFRDFVVSVKENSSINNL